MKVISVIAVAVGALCIAVLLSGCGLTQAPDVSVPERGGATVLSTECDSSSPQEASGRIEVRYSKSDGSNPQERQWKDWIYWRAGLNCVVYDSSQEFFRSQGWDMGIQKGFPIMRSNGGDTARGDSSKGDVDTGGKAAFAVMPDRDNGELVLMPAQASEILSLEFREDRKEPLAEGMRPDFQNMLVNQIGPGFLASYVPEENHKVELSQRVFILRGVDGVSYYALRFDRHDALRKTFGFEWKRLF
ncbi:MAG: hypothetical protein AB1540_12890 [Bdellovibrionota bacterium]